MHIQLSLIPTIIKSAYLRAESAKQAFYSIKIVEDMGKYSVVKESGCSGKIMHKQVWNMSSIEEANSFFNRKLKEKTKNGRKRTYKRIKNDKR